MVKNQFQDIVESSIKGKQMCSTISGDLFDLHSSSYYFPECLETTYQVIDSEEMEVQSEETQESIDLVTITTIANVANGFFPAGSLEIYESSTSESEEEKCIVERIDIPRVIQKLECGKAGVQNLSQAIAGARADPVHTQRRCRHSQNPLSNPEGYKKITFVRPDFEGAACDLRGAALVKHILEINDMQVTDLFKLLRKRDNSKVTLNYLRSIIENPYPKEIHPLLRSQLGSLCDCESRRFLPPIPPKILIPLPENASTKKFSGPNLLRYWLMLNQMTVVHLSELLKVTSWSLYNYLHRKCLNGELAEKLAQIMGCDQARLWIF